MTFGVYEFAGYESGVRVGRFSDEWWTVLLTRNVAEDLDNGHWISSSSKMKNTDPLPLDPVKEAAPILFRSQDMIIY